MILCLAVQKKPKSAQDIAALHQFGVTLQPPHARGWLSWQHPKDLLHWLQTRAAGESPWNQRCGLGPWAAPHPTAPGSNASAGKHQEAMGMEQHTLPSAD